MSEAEEIQKNYSGKPLQLLSFNEKMKNDMAWAKETMKYYIDNANFGQVQADVNLPDFKTKKSLYDAYNNIIPSTMFDYVTNPLAATQDKYKTTKARIRPYNILRPNIDLYIGEWNKRPFKYDVVNLDGDDVFNGYLYKQNEVFKRNVTQRFINTLTDSGFDTGLNGENIPDPKTVISDFNGSYKDAKALRGYRSLKVIEYENRTKELWRSLFKDWLIAGEVFTLKLPHKGKLLYLRLSPLFTDYDKSSLSPYVEDGEYAVCKFRVTVSDIVDLHYDELKEKDIIKLENNSGLGTSTRIFNFMAGAGDDVKDYISKQDLMYVCWKSKKEIGILTYPDPVTGEMQQMEVAEGYQVDKEKGESVEWMWVNDVWHGWRAGDDKDGTYLAVESLEAQRNEANNFSSCKLPINGKRFSDTESSNVSILWLGMSYQIFYIIMQYRIELTVAKSKGRIVLIDGNVINDDDDGGEEKFLWYAEEQGWAFVYRDNEGVDRNFNQYQVLDLSLYDNIKQLIDIANYVKSEWDELLGITRGRKGQTASSDQVGTTNASIFRSTVISDLVFTGFEEFLETELQGLLDNSKFAWVDGKKGNYRNDEGTLEMLNLEPEDHVNASYGVFIQNISAMLDKLEMIKANINAIAQRKDVKPSTILDFTITESFTELRSMLKKAEAIEQSVIEATAENEAERAKEMEAMRQEYLEINHRLELDKMHQQEDRLDNREYIKASLDKDPGAGVDPYLAEVEKNALDRLDKMEKARQEQAKLNLKKEDQVIKREQIASAERQNKENNKVKLKNKVAGEK